ncbi:MAG: IS3 family transposase, partial [Trichlorobacter sp.]|nr:IS3 family transposase [Trichlorobacter sp.]
FFAKYKTKDDARKDITDYIEMFYNSKRRHSYLGNVSPREYEDKYHQKKVA